MQNRQSQKVAAITALRKSVEAITSQNREPDKWERVHFAAALNAAFNGQYVAARVYAEKAVCDLDQRSEKYQLPFDPVYDRISVYVVEQAIEAAEAEPVELHPQFGPILLK